MFYLNVKLGMSALLRALEIGASLRAAQPEV